MMMMISSSFVLVIFSFFVIALILGLSTTTIAAAVENNNDATRKTTTTTTNGDGWIRGVNIGGWLVAEPFITPYLFAITSCHINGDFCYYPGQISAPPLNGDHTTKHVYCDKYQCQPHFITNNNNSSPSYPMDEWTLMKSFKDKSTAKEYMSIHWDHFVTKSDIKILADAGVTHVRVPVPHYMFDSKSSKSSDNLVEEEEPWVNGQWMYFVRFVNWVRQYKMQIWMDLHTAPGSQNGFDNSGRHMADAPTCHHWDTSQRNINRTIWSIQQIATAVMEDNVRDVVTGFGILNEPWSDCNRTILEKFTNQAFEIVRNTMGHDTHVFISDNFNSSSWNNGWWTDPDKYMNTYLDSHYYQVFGETERQLSPKQHIAYTCSKFQRGMDDCCYQQDEEEAGDDNDNNSNRQFSNGMSRIVGEWSAAYDTLPVERVHDIMKGIQDNFTAPFLQREITPQQKEFLLNLVKAQMVTYENANGKQTGNGSSRGWFYWTIKTEGGAFLEWSFLRGIQDGWIPKFPSPFESSESKFGSCRDIAEQTKDDVASVIHEFPDPITDSDRIGWGGPVIDDDYVLSHAGGSSSSSSSNNNGDNSNNDDTTDKTTIKAKKKKRGWNWFIWFGTVLFSYGVWKVYLKDTYGIGRRRPEYQPLHSTSLTI